MKLGSKIILPIFFLLVILIMAFGYLLVNLKQQQGIILMQGARIRLLNGLNERLGRQQEQTDYNVLAYRFNPERTHLLSISQAEIDISKTLDGMYPHITTDKGRELMNNYITAKSEVESLRADLIKAIDEGNETKINLTFNRWNIKTQNIKAALADIGAFNINSLEKTLLSIQDTQDKITRFIIILMFIILLVGIILLMYFKVMITAPIIHLARFSDQLANKNFNATSNVKNNKRKDELGILFRSFDKMASNLKESYANLEKKVQDRTKDLEQAKAKDDAILASIGDGIAVADETGKLIFLNGNAKKILGSDANHDVSDTWQGQYGIFDPVTFEPFPADKMPLAMAVRGQSANKITMFVRNQRVPSGRFISVTSNPIKLNGKTIGGVSVIRDMTQENKIDKAKSEFVSLASHQLRTPLSAINWYTEMLIAGDAGKLNAEQKKYVGEVYAGNQRMVQLVNALLNVSRLELGTFVIEPELTDIVLLAQAVIDEQKQSIKAKKVLFSAILPKDTPLIEIDPKLMRMVFQNLLANAIKYSPEGGEVSFTVLQKNKKTIQIKIADNGYGIPMHQQDKIFTKLFRADNVREKDTEGTGLGLYIVKSIVDNSGGQIWFESAENQGSTFYVMLPLKSSKKTKKSGKV